MKNIPKSVKIRAMLAAVFIALCFVFMGVWVRMMSESFTTSQQVYIRLLVSSVLAFILLRRKFNGLFSGLSKKDWGIYALRAFTYYTIGVGFGAIAVQHTSLSTVAFISSLPVAGLMAWIMFREKIPAKSAPFILLSILGLGLVAGVTLGGIKLGVGEIAAVASMLGFNIGFMLSRLHNKAKNNYENTAILLMLAWIPLFLGVLVTRQPLLPSSVSAKSAVALLISSLMNILIIVLVNFVFNTIKAYVAASLLLLEGFFAIIIGFILYGEKPSLSAVVGGIIIVGCALAINKIEFSEKTRSETKVTEQPLA